MDRFVCVFCVGSAFAVLPPFGSYLAKSLCDPFSPLALLGSPTAAPGETESLNAGRERDRTHVHNMHS